jgi:hypothetical protein
MNKLTHYLQPRDWWPRAYFWLLMIVAMSQAVMSCNRLETTQRKLGQGEARVVTVNGCQYVVTDGYNGLQAITHAGNCGNHGSNTE